MQQLSGSVGRGGTQTPAISLLFWSISDLRSAGPASRDPKTILALATNSSFESAVMGIEGFVGANGAYERLEVVGEESGCESMDS